MYSALSWRELEKWWLCSGDFPNYQRYRWHVYEAFLLPQIKCLRRIASLHPIESSDDGRWYVDRHEGKVAIQYMRNQIAPVLFPTIATEGLWKICPYIYI